MVVAGVQSTLLPGGQASSTHGMFVDIGGAGVVIESSSSATVSALRARFGRFETAHAAARLAIDVVEDARELPADPDTSGRGEPSCIEGDGFTAAIDWGRMRSRVFGSAAVDGVEAVMRLALPHVLSDGLLVHAAVLCDGARGLLCVGPSGAGKSTLARLLPDRSLGDELAVVRHTSDGWIAGSFPTVSARPGTVPLARIFFLRHAQSHERRPLSAARSAGKLAEQSHWLTEDPERGRTSFGLATRLAQEIPSFDLGFAVDPTVWNTMTAPE